MPANILNLPHFFVSSFTENEHDYHVMAVTEVEVKLCINCQSKEIYRFGKREQLIKDLPMHAKRVGIYVDTKRYRCKSCGKTFFERLPGVDEKRHMTDRLIAWIGKSSIKRTFSSIAEEVGITEGTVRLIFKDYVKKLENRIKFDTPAYMGIDEIHIIKKPRGVITNIESKTIVELLVNRNKVTVIQYLSSLPSKEKIKCVAMDMWEPYKDAVQQVMPSAVIVIDKFHVVRMASVALEIVRKAHRASLSAPARRRLMHDRFILLKRPWELSSEERLKLNEWIENFPELDLGYSLKESFYGIYDSSDKYEALDRYQAWELSVPPHMRDAFAPLIKAWRNWQPYILNYFEHKITNAYTESLNNLIRVANRNGRGYSFDVLRAKMLFAEGAIKKELIKPKFERQQHGKGLPEEVFAMYGLPNDADNYINLGVDIATLAALIENDEI
jgi:transposase